MEQRRADPVYRRRQYDSENDSRRKRYKVNPDPVKKAIKKRAQKGKARIELARLRLGNKCNSCGATGKLDFDHVDPQTKKANVTVFVGSSDATFWKEVAKCQLLCRPCHNRKTFNR